MNDRLLFALRTMLLICAAFLAACSGQATSSPSIAPTAGSSGLSTSAPSAPPSAAPRPTHPPLTGSFTSTLHGLSISYPAGWTPRAATEPWPDNGIVMQESAFGDVIEDFSADNLFLAFASRPMEDAAFESFASSYLELEGCGPGEPITVDGAEGAIGTACPMALLLEGGRVYLFWLYGDDDLDWFREILATVELDPEAAVD